MGEQTKKNTLSQNEVELKEKKNNNYMSSVFLFLYLKTRTLGERKKDLDHTY